MPTIRQEVSLLNATLTNASTFGQDIVRLDTTWYVSPTYYFEVIAKNTNVSTAGTVQLFNSTDAGNVTNSSVSVPANTSTFTRYRSSAMTIPAGAKEYYTASFSLSGLSVKAARIIVIANPATLTSTETQIEIGNQETGKTNTTDAALSFPKYWKYTAANWDGTKTFYAEVTYNRSSNMDSTTIKLQEDNGSFASWADKVTIVSAGTATAATRVRSSSFTPTDGRNYRIVSVSSSNMSSYSIFNAKIIVDQVSGAQLITSSGSQRSIIGGSNLNSAAAQGFTIGSTATVTGVKLRLAKIGSPTDTVQVDVTSSLGGSSLASASMSASSLGATHSTYTFTFGSPVSLTGGSKYFIEISRSPNTQDATNYFYSDYINTSRYPDGGYANRNNTTWGSESSTEDLFFDIQGQTGVTLLEPQYLLLNTADDNTTNKQGTQTLWDSSEWADVTNVYKHAMSSDNASNSADLVDIDNSDTQVTNSSVTGANQQISAALTMPTSGHQIDTDIDNTTGTVAGSRILVAVTVSTGPASQTVTPNAIASTTTFYGPTITTGAVTVIPNHIASSTTFYSSTTSHIVYPNALAAATTLHAPTVTVGAVTVTPNHLAATTTFYTLTVSPGVVIVTPNAIASTTTFYAPSVAQLVSPAHIASVTQIHSPTITTGVVTVSPNHIAATTVIYSPTSTVGMVTVVPNHLAAGTTFHSLTITSLYTVSPNAIGAATIVHAPTISVGAVTVSPNHIAATTTIHQPTITVGGVTVVPNHLTATTTFYAPVITTAQSVTPNHLASSTTIHAPTITVGSVTVSPNALAAATTIHNPTVTSLATVAPNHLGATTTFHTLTVTTGAVTVSPGHLAAATSFYTATVTTGGVTVSPNHLAAFTTLYSPTVTVAGQTTTPDHLASTTTIHAPTVTGGGITVVPDHLAAATTLHAPTITVGTVTVSPAHLASSTTIHSPSVSVGAVTVTPGHIAATTNIYTPSVSALYTITPNHLASTTTFYGPSLSIIVFPNFLISGTQLYVPVITPGSVNVSPNPIASITTIYAPVIVTAQPYRILRGSRPIRGPRPVRGSRPHLGPRPVRGPRA